MQSTTVRWHSDGHLFNLYTIMSITAALCILTFTVPVHAKQISDVDITSAVETALFKDHAVPADNIDVKTDKGVVTLTGKVDSWQEKELSTAVAKGVRCVKDVRNDLAVKYRYLILSLF